MENILQKIEETTAYLQARGFTGALTGVVLGTGLGAFVDLLNVEQSIPYSDIPHFPVSTVEFHKGQLILGTIGNKKIIAMQGRFHYYEGYSMQQITFPVRILKNLGVTNLLLSNAAGGMNKDYKKGDLVMIDDHINMLPENPLRGLNSPMFGNRFVDMSQPYSEYLNKGINEAAEKLSINLKRGIYVSVMGPNLETRAEYRQLRLMGADMVGMSTVPEVIVAAHVGMQCAAVSVITDECDPDNLKPINISEIIAVAAKADSVLSELFKMVITNLT
ncbi:MAG: purine-nucleoside phosphorylase [Ferruginibacter sp.]